MAIKNKNVKDKSAFDFNPITGKLDLVRKFNVDRIVTAELNSMGRPVVTYDQATGRYLELGPQPITDDEGNLIVVGT